MKKNILIFGAARAGKSTLAKKLNEELNYYAFSIDKIVTAFMRAYPQLDINYTNEQTSAKLAPFLGHFLGASCCSWNAVEGNKFVIEGYFDFEKIIPIWDLYDMEEFTEYFLFIGLIYPNQTPDKLCSDIRKHDKEDDWTCGLSDSELRSHAINGIEYSRSFNDKFQKYAPIVYDVSYNREQVLDTIVNDIKVRFGIL